MNKTEKIDTRTLSRETRGHLRRLCIQYKKRGMKQREIAVSQL